MWLEIEAFLDRHLTAKEDFSDAKPFRFAHHEHEIIYFPEELHELCRLSIEVFSKEPSLARMDSPCVVVGDLHGAFYVLPHLIRFFRDNCEDFSKKFVFLGNYVSCGSHSLETICFILALKVANPSNYMVLRGNKECVEMSREYGFHDELVERFGLVEGEKLFNHFNVVFSWMPLAGIVGGTVFCVNGGLSPHLKSLEDIEKIPRPLPYPALIPLAEDLLWSDPRENIIGFRPHSSNGRSVNFGADEVAKFCENMDIDFIIRGNQKQKMAIECFADNKLFTLCSLPRVDDSTAAVIRLYWPHLHSSKFW